MVAVILIYAVIFNISYSFSWIVDFDPSAGRYGISGEIRSSGSTRHRRARSACKYKQKIRNIHFI